MDKKQYVGKYVQVLDGALKGLFDESREDEIIAADKDALGEDYEKFEETITKAFDMVEAAKKLLVDFAEELD